MRVMGKNYKLRQGHATKGARTAESALCRTLSRNARTRRSALLENLAVRHSRLRGQPPWMIRAVAVQATRQQTLVATVRVHHPDGRRATSLGAAENNQFPIRRFAGAEIPDGRPT